MKTTVISVDQENGTTYHVTPKYAIGQKVFVLAFTFRTIHKEECECCGHKAMDEYIDEWKALEAVVEEFTITIKYNEDIHYCCKCEHYDRIFREEMMFTTIEQAEEACAYLVSKDIKEFIYGFEALRARNEHQ